MKKIEGVPEGYELVGFVRLLPGDEYIDTMGMVDSWDDAEPSRHVHPKVIKVQPVCTWVHGMFKDGWIAEDESGGIYWFGGEPATSEAPRNEWHSTASQCFGIEEEVFIMPVFREDLPWNERIQEVGPAIESRLK